MTRKDYVMIAEVLKEQQSTFEEGEDGNMLLSILAKQFANRLEQENPRFDRARFLTACGVK